jgi:hypothetical protein
MNERIREIKESTRPEIDWEARHYVELNNGEKEKWMDEWFEKFAELIVQECADVVEKNLYQNIGWNTSRAVRRHFRLGPEE